MRSNTTGIVVYQIKILFAKFSEEAIAISSNSIFLITESSSLYKKVYWYRDYTVLTKKVADHVLS